MKIFWMFEIIFLLICGGCALFFEATDTHIYIHPVENGVAIDLVKNT